MKKEILSMIGDALVCLLGLAAVGGACFVLLLIG